MRRTSTQAVIGWRGEFSKV